MDDTYDQIILGTGLKECILSGIMSSIAKKNVLHLDRNSYYGGESASLNLEQLYARFRPEEKDGPPSSLGQSRKYCIDLCPKFLMACGNLVKILLKTKVTSYLEFRSVAGSFVMQKGKIYKVPASPTDAASSPILGFFEKSKFVKFIKYIGDYDPADAKTHVTGKTTLDVESMTVEDLYAVFKLSDAIKRFTGHAIALYNDEKYLQGPAMDLIDRCQLYANSVARYGNSPYIYPKWGLGGLPEGFSRRCAVHGGVYMLNSEEKPNFVEKIHYNDEGMVTGVQVGGEIAACSQVIGDPSYWAGTDKVKKIGQVARVICILDHPIAKTKDADSCQIIIPAEEAGRNSAIYVCMSSYQHNIAAEGKYIAVCSAQIEENKDGEPQTAEEALGPAIALFGAIIEKFEWISDVYEACNDPKVDGCFITTSYDATTHFETCSTEVLAIYEKIIGEPLDLENSEVLEDVETQ